jgi:hypothetical protein
MTLPAGEFIRVSGTCLARWLLQDPHFAFLGNAQARATLALIRGLLDLPAPKRAPEPADYRDRYVRLFGRSLAVCSIAAATSSNSSCSRPRRCRRSNVYATALTGGSATLVSWDRPCRGASNARRHFGSSKSRADPLLVIPDVSPAATRRHSES